MAVIRKTMKTRYDYKICPNCGAALDVGESCDCMQEERQSRRMATKILREFRTAHKIVTAEQSGLVGEDWLQYKVKVIMMRRFKTEEKCLEYFDKITSPSEKGDG